MADDWPDVTDCVPESVADAVPAGALLDEFWRRRRVTLTGSSPILRGYSRRERKDTLNVESTRETLSHFSGRGAVGT